MKVKFRQSGGFAGLVRGVEVEATELDEAARQALNRLQSDRSAFDTVNMNPDARDLRQYELCFEDEQGVTTLVCDELSLPPDAEPLVQYLQQRARPLPR